MESQKLSDLLAEAKKENQGGSLSAEELYKKALEALDASNMHEAIDLLKTASSMGYANASCELGLISSIAGHEDIGLDWYRLAAEQGNSYAQSQVADAEIKAENYPEAIKWYRKSAEQGLPNAILKLALCYDQGQYIEEDKAVAAKWFRKLAEMQDVTGQYKVYSKHYPFEKEATHLQSIAQYCLGLSYLNGEGVEKNIEEAKKWIRLAAEKGYEDAKNTLQEIEIGGEDSDLSYAERKMKGVMDDKVKNHESPALPKASRIKKTAPRFIFRVFLFLLFVAVVVLIRRMDQMSFRSIGEDEAMEMAQEVKVSIPDQQITLLDSKASQALKVGSTVKVLGVYKQKLNKGNSPRVYWTNQHYLIELADGQRGYGPLMETAIGQRTVLPEGDTVVITAVKKQKKAPIVQLTQKESRYDYAYTLEGRTEPFALEDLHIYFPQRVAYLGEGLSEDKYTIVNDTLSENKKDFQKVKKIFLYDIRPITKKNGFFLFPKYQIWNEFLLQRWFRMLLLGLAYILEIILIFKFLGSLGNFWRNLHGIFWFRRQNRRAKRGDIDAWFEIGDACYIGDSYYGVREENMGQALKWFRKAAERGQGDACARLGHIYETGESVKKDPDEAYKWYEKGHHSNRECAEGMKRIIGNELGLIYLAQGRDAEDKGDYTKAFSLYKQGAEYGYDHAQYELARCYLNGQGTAKNQSEAAIWYQKAADQGYAMAQTALALCYFQGWGVKQDQDEGIEWLKKAARQGEESAQNMLKSLNISY